jgi:hypothetical protein
VKEAGIQPRERVVFTERSRLGRRSWTGSPRTTPSFASPASCRRLLLRRRAEPLLFIDAFTSARSHQGQDRPSHSSVDAPAFEPRGNTVSATALPRMMLVVPAIELGWESFL